LDLNAWLGDTRLVVCVGSGGVGKTTTAAAIGLWGALAGRKTMVLTIDPAKRLANSLGLSAFGNEEMRIDLAGQPDTKGELWAMMLDSRSTWDNLIIKASPDEATRQRILDNHVYRHMADTFAGSQDYMATEKLYDLVYSNKYDLVVLDTPPVKNALDFLESPGKLVNFLDERVLSWYLVSRSPRAMLSRRLMAGTSAVVYRLLGYIFGDEFLDDIAQLFQEFKELYAGFRERHDAVVKLFREPSTGFVTVCAPNESSLDVASFFQEELKSRELTRAGVIVNQVHRCSGTGHNAKQLLGNVASELSKDLPPQVAQRVLARLGMAHRRLYQLSQAEAAMVEQVRVTAKGGGFYVQIPRLEGQVHTLDALHQVGHHLFQTSSDRL
jgi:anion-transporting  ArsA/GET3 family ATPase